MRTRSKLHRILATTALACSWAGCAAPLSTNAPVGRAETHGEQPPPPALTAVPTTPDDEHPPSTPEPVAAAAEPQDDSPLTFLDNFHAIVEGRVYRSAQVRPETIAYARRRYGVQTVINLRGTNERDEWYQQERAACAAEGIQLIDVRLSSTELPLPEELLKLYDALTAAPEPVLLHCKAGADRTGLAASMWRRLRLHEDAEQAGLQLSVLYGHFRGANPAMIDFIRMFEPSREWIENEYPRLREEYISRQSPPAASKEET